MRKLLLEKVATFVVLFKITDWSRTKVFCQAVRDERGLERLHLSSNQSAFVGENASCYLFISSSVSALRKVVGRRPAYIVCLLWTPNRVRLPWLLLVNKSSNSSSVGAIHFKSVSYSIIESLANMLNRSCWGWTLTHLPHNHSSSLLVKFLPFSV